MDPILKRMHTKALEVLQYAYAPYSHFSVASTLFTENGNLYAGVNVENSSYGLTICAESSAIANMITAGEKSIQKMLILSSANALCPPCGACRQRIFEFSNANTLIYMCDDKTILKTLSITELLPLGFKL